MMRNCKILLFASKHTREENQDEYHVYEKNTVFAEWFYSQITFTDVNGSLEGCLIKKSYNSSRDKC